MTKSVQNLLEDIRLLGEVQFDLVQAVRSLVDSQFPDVEEVVKYGGILFSSGVQFCGVFAYKEHVSVEFGAGAKIKDSIGLLEGTGKGRRHIKLRTVADIEAKQLPAYLKLAHAAALASKGCA
jgi:hypothetical protein